MRRKVKRIVLITGATKGIGLATSQKLYESGYKVIGIARNEPKQSFCGEFFKCDLADTGKTTDTLREIHKQFPYIDGVINNVGIALPEALGHISLDSLNTVLDLNVRTAVQITQVFIEGMREKKHGRIINIASRAVQGVKNRSAYAAAKSALIGLTRTWALELASYGITVNAVSPGPTETELFRQSRPVGSDAEKETIAQIPMCRVGKPLEIAATIEFLLSDGAAFITGQNIFVDGGASL